MKTKAKTLEAALGDLVAYARSQGELNYRSFLLKEELKALHLQGKEDSAFLKREKGDTARRAEHRLALKDHIEHLVRKQCLTKQELEQVERLSFEMKLLIGEKTRSLLS